MAFEEDLSLFLSDEEFAVVATATTRFAERVQFQVIFDNGYAAFISGMAEATQPSCLARTVDVADLEHGCAIDIGTDLWKVVGTEPDGTGMTTLRLRKP